MLNIIISHSLVNISHGRLLSMGSGAGLRGQHASQATFSLALSLSRALSQICAIHWITAEDCVQEDLLHYSAQLTNTKAAIKRVSTRSMNYLYAQTLRVNSVQFSLTDNIMCVFPKPVTKAKIIPIGKMFRWFKLNGNTLLSYIISWSRGIFTAAALLQTWSGE